MKYVIIGFSAAGLSAAKAIRENDSSADITVITEEVYPTYSKCLLTYYIKGKVNDEALFLISQEQLKYLNINLKTGCQVIGLDVKQKKVIFKDKGELTYDKILIVTGAAPLIPRDIFDNINKAFTLRSYDDAKSINDVLKESRNAIVLGDGLVAVTVAQALKERGLDISLVGLSEYLLSQFLDKKAGTMVEKQIESQGIDLYMETTINKVELDDCGEISKVVLSDNTEMACDFIILAVGINPNIGFLADTPIKVDKGVLVNKYLETNISDVYAAGDVAQGLNCLTGRADVISLWPNAVEQGEIAGCNMTGQKKMHRGSLTMNSVNIGEYSIITAGITDSTENNVVFYEYFNENYKEYRKLVVKEGKLIGYILVGDTKKAGILSSLITNSIDITTHIDDIRRGIISYSKIVT